MRTARSAAPSPSLRNLIGASNAIAVGVHMCLHVPEMPPGRCIHVSYKYILRPLFRLLQPTKIGTSFTRANLVCMRTPNTPSPRLGICGAAMPDPKKEGRKEPKPPTGRRGELKTCQTLAVLRRHTALQGATVPSCFQKRALCVSSIQGQRRRLACLYPLASFPIRTGRMYPTIKVKSCTYRGILRASLAPQSVQS